MLIDVESVILDMRGLIKEAGQKEGCVRFA
jgi:hypothetical protein